MKNRLIQFVALTALLVWAINASALSLIGEEKEEPLLEAAEAFQTQVALTDDNQLNVEINIAPGYFVYKSRISVSSEHAEFGELDIPPGKVKQDQFFGEVETYRDILNYSSPLLNTEVTGPLKVKVTSQGCADVGICYPPYSEIHTVEVSASFKEDIASQDSGNNEAASGNALAQLTPVTPAQDPVCLLYTSPSPRDRQKSRMPSSA